MDDSSQVDTYFCFKLSGQSYALALTDIREVLFITELSVELSLSPAFLGYLNLRGEALPIYHLARLLTLIEAPPSLYDHMLIMHTADHGRFGLLTDGINKIMHIRRQDIVKAPDAKRGSAQPPGLLPDGPRFVPLLDLSYLSQVLKDCTSAPDQHIQPTHLHAS